MPPPLLVPLTTDDNDRLRLLAHFRREDARDMAAEILHDWLTGAGVDELLAAAAAIETNRERRANGGCMRCGRPVVALQTALTPDGASTREEPLCRACCSSRPAAIQRGRPRSR